LLFGHKFRNQQVSIDQSIFFKVLQTEIYSSCQLEITKVSPTEHVAYYSRQGQQLYRSKGIKIMSFVISSDLR
jgi:hypothetical protein